MKTILKILFLFFSIGIVGCGSGGTKNETNIPAPTITQHIIYEGTGDNITDKFYLHADILATFNSIHDGELNFIIWLLYAETGERVVLLVNEIGAYSGTIAHNPSGNNYILQIIADGNWSIEINQEE